MATPILLLSANPLDAEGVRRFAESIGTTVRSTVNRDEAWALMVQFPEAIVFWDVDDATRLEAVAALIATAAKVERVFAVGSQPLYSYPVLFRMVCFGHFLSRVPNYLDHPLLRKLANNALIATSTGLALCFPSGTRIQSIKLKSSGEKIAAVEAVNQFLLKIGVSDRVAQLAVQGADELLMNAIFDAPVNAEGVRFRKSVERSDQFNLDPRENITLEIASTDDYVGIGVCDSYGSFNRQTLGRFLSKNYSTGEYTIWKNDPGAGLGIYSLVHSGLSVRFASQAGVRTDAQVFFANTKSFKTFREGFRFVSVQLP